MIFASATPTGSSLIEREARVGKIKTKWDSLDKGLQKWATRIGAVVAIGGALAGAGTWLLNQIDSRFSAQTVELKSEIDEVKLSSMRNELFPPA